MRAAFVKHIKQKEIFPYITLSLYILYVRRKLVR